MGIIQKKRKKAPKTRPLVSPSKQIAGEGEYHTQEEILSLFKKLGVQYLEHTVFSNKCAIFRATKRIDLTSYLTNTAMHRRREKQFLAMKAQASNPPYSIRWISAEIGYGVFASREIAKGELLGEYTGIVWPRSDVKDRTWSWKYPIRGEFAPGFPTGFSLDGGKYGNAMRFINHGDKRNISTALVYNGKTWVSCYYARSTIAKEEELLVSYGSNYWKHRVKLPL